MGLKFRLKGLAETFIEALCCPICSHDGGEEGDQGFSTSFTRVTFEGIIVVIQCQCCGMIFVPEGQRLGIIDGRKLRDAVQKDSKDTGEPIFPSVESVRLNVEKLNAERNGGVH